MLLAMSIWVVQKHNLRIAQALLQVYIYIYGYGFGSFFNLGAQYAGPSE